jgi:hypothetical protein
MELRTERNRGKFGDKKYHKMPENIADSAGGHATEAWAPSQPVLQKPSENALVYRFLLRAQKPNGPGKSQSPSNDRASTLVQLSSS